MKKHWIKIAALLLIVTVTLFARLLPVDQYLSIANVMENKEQLLFFIKMHYVQAVLCYICLYISTALFLPGALALTVAGGMMFGAIPASIYTNIGATTGALLAFLVARFAIADWFQERFKKQLSQFNQELSRHGGNYLLILRVLPIAPFFVVNYCAGVTKLPLKTFVWTTSLGIIPGSLIYAFMGEQLRHVNATADLFSGKVLLALLLLALFVLLPVIRHHLFAAKK